MTHWAEKYRPTRLDECILLSADREMFKAFVRKGHAPHLLLVGPPGIGKTSVGLALANDMNWQVLHKNAAAYGNIEAVRTEITDFAMPGSLVEVMFPDWHGCALLDEADHMPAKAQAAQRRLMEEASAGGRCNFTLTANDIRKIDPAIRSRCAVVNFTYSDAVDREAIIEGFLKRLEFILATEGIEWDWTKISRALKAHDLDLDPDSLATGTLDFRAVLNELQARP